LYSHYSEVRDEIKRGIEDLKVLGTSWLPEISTAHSKDLANDILMNNNENAVIAN